MAIYKEEDLRFSISLLSQKGPGTRAYNVKKHLKTPGPHGTDQCEYCNLLAKDLGYLPDPIDNG